MVGGPHWSGMVSALAITTVAILGAFVAWNLWQTNQNILRERLFDRRFAIFQATQELISSIGNEGAISWEDANGFADIAQRSRFMFSSDDAQYFDLLRRKAMELAAITATTDGKRASQVMQATEKQGVLCAWFDDQVEEVFSRMSKYLLFEK